MILKIMKNFIVILGVLASIESSASLNVVKAWREHRTRSVLERDRKSDVARCVRDYLQNYLPKDLCTIVDSYDGDWHSKNISPNGWFSRPHYSVVRCLSAGRIVTGNDKGTLNIIDLNSERSLCSGGGNVVSDNPVAAIVPDGGSNMYVGGHWSGKITLYDIQNCREKSRLVAASRTISCLLFYAPNVIISGSDLEDSIYYYNDKRLICKGSATAPGYGTLSFAAASDSEFISTSIDGYIRQWLLTPSIIHMIRSVRVGNYRLSPHHWDWKGVLMGDKVVVAASSQPFIICDMRSGKVSPGLGIMEHQSRLRDIVAYGDLLISCSAGNRWRTKGLIEMHDIRYADKALQSIELPGYSTASLAIDSASKTLVAVSDENIIKIQL
jgi:hypothetical protein